MKESKAEKMFCPFKFIGAMLTQRPVMPHCEGSACMMWVMTFKHQDERKYDNEGYCAFRKTNFSVE